MGNSEQELTFRAINRILQQWNPLDVEGPALKNEYEGYIPAIIKNSYNINALQEHLEEMIINNLGIHFDRTNSFQKEDLLNIARQIFNVTNGQHLT